MQTFVRRALVATFVSCFPAREIQPVVQEVVAIRDVVEMCAEDYVQQADGLIEVGQRLVVEVGPLLDMVALVAFALSGVGKAPVAIRIGIIGFESYDFGKRVNSIVVLLFAEMGKALVVGYLRPRARSALSIRCPAARADSAPRVPAAPRRPRVPPAARQSKTRASSCFTRSTIRLEHSLANLGGKPQLILRGHYFGHVLPPPRGSRRIVELQSPDRGFSLHNVSEHGPARVIGQDPLCR